MTKLLAILVLALLSAGNLAAQYIQVVDGLIVPLEVANPWVRTVDSCSNATVAHGNAILKPTAAVAIDDAIRPGLQRSVLQAYSRNSNLALNLFLSSPDYKTVLFDSVNSRAYIDSILLRMMVVPVLDLRSGSIRKFCIYHHDGPRFQTIYAYEIESDRFTSCSIRYRGQNLRAIDADGRAFVMASTRKGSANETIVTSTSTQPSYSGGSRSPGVVCVVPPVSKRSSWNIELKFTRRSCTYRVVMKENDDQQSR